MSTPPGNNPELWEKLIVTLDEKLQLGVIDKLKQVDEYHFEGDTMYLICSQEELCDYFNDETQKGLLSLYLSSCSEITNIVVTKSDAE